MENRLGVIDEKTRRILENSEVLFSPNRDAIKLGVEYPIDEYDVRVIYREDSTEPTHFVITRAN